MSEWVESILEGSCGEDGNRAGEVVVGQVPGDTTKSSHEFNSTELTEGTKANGGVASACRAVCAYRKESCGILASDAGNGPDKLLLFSLLRQ